MLLNKMLLSIFSHLPGTKLVGVLGVGGVHRFVVSGSIVTDSSEDGSVSCKM